MTALRTVALLLAVAATAAADAADAPPVPSDTWYRVEVVIFERLGEVGTEEIVQSRQPRTFPLDAIAFDDDAGRANAYLLDDATRSEAAAVQPPNSSTQVQSAPIAAAEPPPAERARALLADYEQQLQRRSYRFEPPTSNALGGAAAALQRSSSYRVVFHRAWIQPLADRDRPLPMLIQAGERNGEAWRIEGTIGVTRGRYLHLDARLWYAVEPVVAPTVAAQADAATDGAGYMELREQRRMRSGELHYLDHPKLGVLARVDPVTMPAELAAEIARLSQLPASTAPRSAR